MASSETLFSPGARLDACAGFVREGKVPADIGTDHAYLPIWLVVSGKAPRAYASDINEEPIRSAVKNIERYGLGDKIKTFTGDGLEPIPHDDVDDIIIAGMGGDNIAAIISRADWLKSSRYRLILQPMSKADRLREFLFANGFDIQEEKAVCEAGKVYTVILAAFADNPVEYTDYDIVAGRLGNDDGNARALLTKQAGILTSEANGAAAIGKVDEERRLRSLAEKLMQFASGGK